MASSGFVASFMGLVVACLMLIISSTNTAVGQEMTGPEPPYSDTAMPRDDDADQAMQDAYNNMQTSDYAGGDTDLYTTMPDNDAVSLENAENNFNMPDDSLGGETPDSTYQYTGDQEQGDGNPDTYQAMGDASAQVGEDTETYPSPGNASEKCETECSPTDVAPVCGNDGTTYPNRCEFNNKKCKVPSLEVMRESDCLAEDRCVKGCPRILKPICASDGRTYANLCELRKEMCKTTDLTSEHEGYC